MIIDSHQHFWKYEPVKHQWINDEMSIIRRDFMPSDLAQVYAENQIDGCVAVQADQTLEETDFL
ncbi:MAG: amidohydrolase, partial [Bacteroidota bacterium]